MSKDIIQTMQARRDRKEMFSAVCNAIVAGCFANPEVDCTMLDLLIDNTANRFNFTRMAENNREY